MTSPWLTRFVRQQPFEPFTMVVADGRELHVPHPEHASLGDFATTLIYMHPTGQIEVVDAAMIVSIRTIRAADLANYSE
jgi:hypothetical protein